MMNTPTKSQLLNYTKSAMMLILTGLILFACKDDDGDMYDGDETGQMTTFALSAVGSSSVSGTATFSELSDGTTKVVIELDGTSSGDTHPIHIHENTAAEGGDIAITLTQVDGESGMSETVVSMKDDGTSISYDELISYDGYINVHQSADDLATLVVQGDIGQNALTGESMTYDLGAVSDPSISGTLTLSERMNGEALAVLELDNTSADSEYPAHIHSNTAAEGGDIAVTFTSISGTTGMSKTNIAMLDDGTSITYDELLEFDGYVNVHASASDLATLVAQGDIGQNTLTGTSSEFTLNAVDVDGVTGMVTFYERANAETLVVIELSGIDFAGDHPTHIHSGSVAEAPGDILITLTSVDDSGMSKTNVSMDDTGEAIDYDAMAEIDGYINVHSSASDLATLVAQGNVGINAD